MKSFFTILITLLLAVTTAFAEGHTGSISGEITDKKTGERIIGATVIITKTTTGTVSNFQGQFLLENLPKGTYSFTCSFIAYQPITIENVRIEAGRNTQLNFSLQQELMDIEEVAVEQKAIRKTANSMLSIQRKSAAIVNGISAEEMALNGDGNAAASVKRVSGITVQGGKYIFIRGLGGRYSKTNLNGMEIPSLDPQRNSVQMDLFPSNIIDNMLIYKTFSPEMPAAFAGGYVNIITRDFPDKFTANLSASTSFNPQANLNASFLGGQMGKYAFLGISEKNSPPASTENGVPFRYENDDLLDKITADFSKQMQPSEQPSGLNQSYSASIGSSQKLFNKPIGFIASLSYNKKYNFYQNGENGHYTLTAADAPYLQKDLIMTDKKGTENILWGGIINTSYKFTKHSHIGINLIHNHAGTQIGREQEGWSLYHEVNMQTRTLQFAERAFSAVQLQGESLFVNFGNLKIKYLSSYTTSTHNEPDLRFFTNIYTEDENGIRHAEIDIAKQDLPSRYFRDMNEINIGNKIDLEYPLKGHTHTLKFGALQSSKKRIFREKIYTYKDNNNSFSGSIEEYLSAENIGQNSVNGYGVFISDGTQESNNYNGSQQINAAYLMAELRFIEKLKISGGIRAESANISVKSLNPDNPKGGFSNFDILPAFNLTYAVSKKTNTRIAYTRTLARPSFRELAPYASFEFAGDFIFVGNEKLERSLIDNIDLKWELFPATGQLFSVGYFYKKFHNPIERTFNPAAGNDELTLENVGSAHINGLEFEAKYSPKFLSNFKFGGNLTLVNSTVAIPNEELEAIQATNPGQGPTREMSGQAPYVVNAFLSYKQEKLGVQSNLNYNISGDKLSVVVKGGTPNIYEKARGQLDFNIRKKIGTYFTVKFSAKNLLDSPYLRSYSYLATDYIYSKYTLGRTYTAGLSYALH